MNAYQKQVLGIKKIIHMEEVWERDAWRKLTKALITEDEENQIRWARITRKTREAGDKWERDGLRYSTYVLKNG
jgi:hypothetical protein